MRDLIRNRQTVYYRNYLGDNTPVLDRNGNETGAYLPTYEAKPSKAHLCVSPNRGSSDVEQFGGFDDYDRTMTTADTDCGINEESILWVDGADTAGAHNYIVKKKALWKNSVQYLIKKVDVQMRTVTPPNET